MTTMSELFWRLNFLSLLLLSCVSPSSLFTFNDHTAGLVACGPHQLQALTQFKNEFDSRSCNLTDYFNGVWCDNTTGAITKLRVPSGCLSGTLKPNSSLFGFHQLRYLNLSNNNFISSSIPSEFGKLNKLEFLSLSSNGFLGQVPSSFSNLSLLSRLDLPQNDLTGNFPHLRNLSKLTRLDLSHNHLSGILYPNSSLFELHQLSYLNLGYNNFSSSLPFEFGNLYKLEAFSLASNGFFGQVPPTISNLTLLTSLYLHTNDLTGSFPLIQNLTKLSLLELSHNHFSGTILPSLFTMPFLSILALTENHFSGPIEIPNSSTSSRLEVLYLGINHFEGKSIEPISKLINLKILDFSFPNTGYLLDLTILSSIKKLSFLDLSGNNISPASLTSDSKIPLSLEVLSLKQCGIKEFPNILKTLENLELIDISNNRINGKIPEWLWSLPRLSSVFIRENLLTGFEGSTEVLVNSSVRVLNLALNNLEGVLPSLPIPINVFAASDNRFKGNIPLLICNRSSLDVLILSNNNFTGPIPSCLSNLTVLSLRKNNLEGSIPDMFYAEAPLQTLHVGYNRLTGKLPRSLVNCSSLKILGVEDNKIKDTFPFWLKALPNLQVLILRSNKFYGPISPPNQGPLAFHELRIFEISNNNFTGNLPPSYFVNWKASSPTNGYGGLYMVNSLKKAKSTLFYSYTDTIDLRYKGLSMEQERIFASYAAIDLSGNRIQGQIPESIGSLEALIALNLSNNAFTGHIPLSFANLVELESLDLSRNQLSGTIPNGLGSLSFLAYINVSHNQLKGEIPQGPQITGQPESSFEGNAGLCGFPLEESCFGTNTPPTQLPKEEDGEEEEQALNWKAVAIGYGPGVLLGLAIAQVIASYKPEWLIKIIGPDRLRAR